jgi:hypothetical protein
MNAKITYSSKQIKKLFLSQKKKKKINKKKKKTMLQCTFCFSFRRKEEIIMKVDDSYKHVDGSNEGNYGSQTKFERHIVFAPFLIIIMAPKRSL